MVLLVKSISCTSRAVSLSPSLHLAPHGRVDRMQADLPLVNLIISSLFLKSHFLELIFL